MTVCDLKRGERAVILSVSSERTLRERLSVLGIHAGARIMLLRASFFKKTFLVSTDSAVSALGRSVAAEVRVCRTD